MDLQMITKNHFINMHIRKDFKKMDYVIVLIINASIMIYGYVLLNKNST